MSSPANHVILIGVDGGASQVRAHEVRVEAGSEAVQYRLGRASATRSYPPGPFEPVDLVRQLEEQTDGPGAVTAPEIERGRVIAAAIVESAMEVALSAGRRTPVRLRLGISMPGLKTADGRGIAVMNNGPRIPDLADRIEAGLRGANVRLTEPIRRIGSDADCCGIGEQHAADGLLRDVDHAYYLGGGTGLAEALKLRGSLLAFDQARAWLAKAWGIRSSGGLTFERLASASAINRRYGRAGDRLGACPTYPEDRAAQGDAAALAVLETAADALAELIFERIDTIYRGRRALDHRGPVYAGLALEHEYRGVLLERIVLGQQIGRLYGQPQYAPLFGNKLDGFLAERIGADHDVDLRRRYLQVERPSGTGQAPSLCLRSGVVMASRLPAAAALGAAINAARES